MYSEQGVALIPFSMTAVPILSSEEHSRFTDEKTEAPGFVKITLGAGGLVKDSDLSRVSTSLPATLLY